MNRAYDPNRSPLRADTPGYAGPAVWAVLTGEYPPQPGGVSDYTRLVARRLAAAGDEVHVWAPPVSAFPPATADAGVHVHRLPDHFGPRGLAVLGRELDRLLRSNSRILVQYVPHGFGCKAMNLPFCLWLARRARRDEVWTLFHEVAYPLARRQRPRHNALALVNRAMAALVGRASRRIFVTIPAWADLLGPLIPTGRTIEWLPVPATLPTEVCSGAVAAVRARVSSGGATVIGHFGTFGEHVSRMLEDVIPPLLRHEDRVGMLIGRRGTPFADRLVQRHPKLAGRLFATGELAPMVVSEHLAACDLAVQPYPDGISCRRTSTMASLALGTPVVTCRGHLTEPLWGRTGAVALAVGPSPEAIVREAERLLREPAARSQLAAVGRATYRQMFDVGRTVEVLRGTMTVTMAARGHERTGVPCRVY